MKTTANTIAPGRSSVTRLTDQIREVNAMTNNLPDPRSAPGKPFDTYMDEMVKTIREVFAVPPDYLRARDAFLSLRSPAVPRLEPPEPVETRLAIGRQMVPSFDGLAVIESEAAVRRERNFPPSRHRSKRVHKKLCKRFGGEYTITPCVLIGDGVMYAHPAIMQKLRERLKLKLPNVERVTLGGFYGTDI